MLFTPFTFKTAKLLKPYLQIRQEEQLPNTISRLKTRPPVRHGAQGGAGVWLRAM